MVMHVGYALYVGLDPKDLLPYVQSSQVLHAPLQHHVEVDTSNHLVMMVTTMVVVMSWVHGQW